MRKPITIIILLLLTIKVGIAQDYETKTHVKKSAIAAGFLSLVMPGGGQYYNEQYLKGGIMTGIYLSGGALLIGSSYSGYPDVMRDIAFIMLIQVELWSIIDAPISAINHNKKHGFAGLEKMSIKPECRLVNTFDQGAVPTYGFNLSLGF